LTLATLAFAAAARAEAPAPETISPAGKWRLSYNYGSALAATANGDLHAVFFERDCFGVYYRRYDRAAGAWGTPIRVDEKEGGNAAIVVTPDDRPHVFFAAGGPIGHWVSDGAERWEPVQYLEVPGARLNFPSPLVLPSGDVAVGMTLERSPGQPPNIAYTVWRAGTGAFEPVTEISAATGAEGSWMPALAYWRGQIHAVWRDDGAGNWDLYERVYDGEWGPVQRLTTDTGTSFHPALVVDGNDTLHLLFMDDRTGRPAIWEMLNDGDSWREETRRFGGDGAAMHPFPLRLPGGKLGCFWEDNHGSPRFGVYYALYDGTAWSPPRCLASSPDVSVVTPSAAYMGDELDVIYAEEKGAVYVQRLALSDVTAGATDSGSGNGGNKHVR
jgi:hypothetical protein